MLCKGMFIFYLRLFRCAEVPWALVFEDAHVDGRLRLAWALHRVPEPEAAP